jgi:hypothetical protein
MTIWAPTTMVDAEVGARPMAAVRFNLEGEAVDVGRHEARRVAEFTGLERVVDVVGEESLGDDVLEGAVRDHLLRPVAAFLAGLSDEDHRAGEIGLHGREDGGDTEKHRRVDVVAAGMHEADFAAVEGRFVLGSEGQVRFLGDGQGVHVAAHGHNGAGFAALQDAQDAGLGVACPDLEAELAEVVRNDTGGAGLLEAEFRVAVDVLPDGDEFWRELVGQRLDLLFEGGRGTKRRRVGGRCGQGNKDTNRDGDGPAFHGLLLMGRGAYGIRNAFPLQTVEKEP